MLIETVKNERAIGKFYVGEPKGNRQGRSMVASVISTLVVLIDVLFKLYGLCNEVTRLKINKPNGKSEKT